MQNLLGDWLKGHIFMSNTFDENKTTTCQENMGSIISGWSCFEICSGQ